MTGTLEANAAVTLDATSSSDPDQGDSIVEYSWTVTRTSAECDAPTVASKTRTAAVVFSCAGTYEVSLSVKDELQAESAPSKLPLVVTGRTGPALVEVGDPQTVEHTCGGTPVECRPATAIQLSATLPNPSFQTVRWTVLPPAGREIGDGTGRTVRFLPSPNVANPTVEVTTDGAAISGDWHFRVEVVDGQTVRDTALARVSINNRPPIIVGVLPATGFNHQYLASNQSYGAAGSFPVQIEDPDGDVVTNELTYRHAGDGEASFEAWPLPAEGSPTQVGFDVGTRRSAELIAAGIERTVVLAASDVNGGSSSATFPIVIANRPPRQMAGPDMSADHSFDVASYRYTSSPRLGSWMDPDGDPIDFDVTTASTDCPEFTADTGTVRLQCAAGGELSAFVRTGRTATVDVSDPFTTVRLANVPFGIGNRRPVINATVYRTAISCGIAGGGAPINCSLTGQSYVPPYTFGPINSLAPTGTSDPDGDPLELQPTAGNAVLTTCPPLTASCSLLLAIPVQYSCNGPPSQTVSFVATDGVASTSGTVTVAPYCR
ncbi:MAG TPA: PKD domain-containing protein [Anaeromyxobacter sp.]|nr:PKD domain-containing protein [Anaeromyxobacter sp.]